MTVWLGETWVEIEVLEWDELGPVWELVEASGPFREEDVTDAIPEPDRGERVEIGAGRAWR